MKIPFEWVLSYAKICDGRRSCEQFTGGGGGGEVGTRVMTNCFMVVSVQLLVFGWFLIE